jgi:hypothetical protein
MTQPRIADRKPRSRSPFRSTAPILVAVVFGLLLWAKLLLVTNHPRTAIADPAPAPPSAAEAPSASR